MFVYVYKFRPFHVLHVFLPIQCMFGFLLRPFLFVFIEIFMFVQRSLCIIHANKLNKYVFVITWVCKAFFVWVCLCFVCIEILMFFCELVDAYCIVFILVC